MGNMKVIRIDFYMKPFTNTFLKWLQMLRDIYSIKTISYCSLMPKLFV